MPRPAASLPAEAKSEDARSPAANRANPSQGAIPVTAKIPVLDKLTAKVAPTPQATAPAGEPALAKDAGLPFSSPVAPSGTTADVFDTSLASLPVEAKPDDAQSPAANRANSSQGAIPDTAKIPVLDKLTAKVAPTPQAIAPAGEPAVTKEAGLPISSPVAPSGTTANVVDTDVASPLPPPPAAQPAPLHDPAKPAQSGMGTATDLKTALKTADPAVVGPETGAMGRSQRNESSAIAAPAAGSPVDAQTGHAQPDHAQSPAPNPVGPSQGAIPDTAKISVLDKLPRETSPPPQPTTRAGEPAVPKEVVFSVSTPVAPSGTPVATYQERMKSAVKENEFAGSALQDLPSDGHIASSAGGAGGASQGAKAGQPVVIDFSTDRETSAQWAAVGITHAGTANLTVTANAGNAGTHAPSPVSQVERMTSREVTMVRQSGAESLAVTLRWIRAPACFCS